MLPVIPDVALNIRTDRGQKLGRGYRHHIDAASNAAPEVANKDQNYRDWIKKALDQGKRHNQITEEPGPNRTEDICHISSAHQEI